MRTIEETTSWYQDVGKSYAKDESGKTLVRLAYAYDNKRKCEDPFYLICLSTIVEEGIDTNYHNKQSCLGNVPMLRRVPALMTDNEKVDQAKLAKPLEDGKTKPKGSNKAKTKWRVSKGQAKRSSKAKAKRDEDHVIFLTRLGEYHASLPSQLEVEDLAWQILEECQCTCSPRVVRDMAYDDYQAMVEDINPREGPQSTSFQLDESQDNQAYYLRDCDDLVRAAFPEYAPLEALSQYDARNYRCYLTELQLQSMVNQQGIQSTGSSDLDMTTLEDGRRVSKWSLEAMEYGEPVPPPLKISVTDWLKNYVGEEKVFPTKNGAPRIMTEFIDRPYKFELRDEYTTGRNPKALPSIKAAYYHGKPATQKVLEHFVRSTPVVSRCDNPRCLSRLVIVPKREPGALKSADPTSYRVTMNALINGCLKPTPSTLPLAVNEIKKLHHYKYFLKVDAANAYWSIPLDDESRRMTAFQTHEGVFAWDRLTMGTRPASTVQQTAYYRAFDRYLPKELRHRYATFADDVAAGADTLEELFELLKAIVICFQKAGIQVKASKMVFGVTEVSFHNYTISKDQTRPKDENLDPIKNCAIPESVTNVKAFLGCTQQMSQYCQYYGLVAAPLHALTRDKVVFPKPWLAGTDYDVSFNRLKSMMLNENLFLWNKVSERRLFIEVDACEYGWGACAYQYADEPTDTQFEDEGRHRLLSKEPKRVVEWMSKAWTAHERELPCFYREALARLLCLEHFRNLIETQDVNSGTTIYTDHAPSTYKGSLSNKGRLSSWRIHETQDLADMVQTLYKAGIHLSPPHGLADALSRLPRGQGFYRLQLPAIMDILLENLPASVKELPNIRVNAEKDTVLAARIVQRWRKPRNPISIVRADAAGPCDFVILAPFADKVTHKIASLIRLNRPFAALVPVDLLHEIDRKANGKIDETVKKKRLEMPCIIIAPLSLAWLVSHPEHSLLKKPSLVLFTTNDKEEADTNPTESQTTETSQSYLEFVDQSLVALDNLMKDGAMTPEVSACCYVSTRAQKKRAEKPQERKPTTERPAKCKHGTPTKGTLSFAGSPPPDPYSKWVGHQNNIEPPEGGKVVLYGRKGYPKKLKAVETKKGKLLIIVPVSQRDRLIKQEHLTVLHVGAPRVLHALQQRYYWPKMKKLVFDTVQSCPDCQAAQVRRKNLNAEFKAILQKDLPLPRQNYGIDFYGHKNGEILVAIDLVTREILLWFLKDRKQEGVAKALLSGLVFTKGVPLKFRSDEAPEFVEGVVAAMNAYLGVTQITTGGHNARGNAIVERANQTIGHMLRTATDSEYKNIKEYLQCISFAHNVTYNSVIEMSPFEAGHGLKARTISEARMDLPRLQFNAEEGMSTDATKLWEKGLPKKVIDVAHEFAQIAQANSEWHRRINAENLNSANKRNDLKLLEDGQSVYFYKPPSQEEVVRRGRKRKHLSFYHGPAKIKSKIRERQYVITYEGKEFTRDIAMIVPTRHMPEDPENFDPIDSGPKQGPSNYKKGDPPLKPGELIICNDSPDSQGWFIAEVHRRLPESVELRYFITPAPPLENHATESNLNKANRLRAIHFKRAWTIPNGKNHGKATSKAPYPNKDLQVWQGPVPNEELFETVLIRGIVLNAEGRMSDKSIALAIALNSAHESTPDVEMEKSVAPALFLRSNEEICQCHGCLSVLSSAPQK